MHVAQFVQRYPPAVGGSEMYAARLCDHLAGHGDRVRYWTTTALDLEAFWEPGRAEVGRGDIEPKATGKYGPSGRMYRPLRFPGRRYLLKALSLVPVRRWQCLTLPCNPVCPGMWRDSGRFTGSVDVVHATAFPYTFPIACGLRLARRANAAFLLTPFLHLGDPDDPHDRTRRQYTRPCLRWLLKQADRVFVQTRAEFRAVVELGVPEGRVVMQGLGVDPAECTGGDREAARRAWGVTPDDTVVGHLANNSVEKGTVDLLTAVGRLGRDAGRRPPRVVLAGPEMANFRRFWATYPLRDRVTRLGVLTDVQKRDFFAGIDAFALPSRTDSFGLVLLEAWANGKPVVVYRAGGPAELVRHEVDGYVADCTVPGLAAAIDRLVTDRAAGPRLGAAGRRRVAAEFCWADKLELVRRVMAEEVGRRKGV
jgi:glycosyltransferase involved in cell wall biosynthesis